jgi:hypothetical protein
MADKGENRNETIYNKHGGGSYIVTEEEMKGFDPNNNRLKIVKVRKPRLETGDIIGLATPSGPSRGKIISITEKEYPLCELELEIIPD